MELVGVRWDEPASTIGAIREVFGWICDAVQDTFLISDAGEDPKQNTSLALKVVGVLKTIAMESSWINVAPLPGAPTISVYDPTAHYWVPHMMLLSRTTSLTATRWYMREHVR